MTNTETSKAKTNMQYPSLGEAKELGVKWLAANPAAVEVEFTVRLGLCHTWQVWIGRDGEAYDRPVDQRRTR